MLGKNFSYRGTTFPWTAAEGRANGWYADVDWTNVPTQNPDQPRQDYHGVIAYPTLSRGRIVEVSGQIFSSSKAARGAIEDALSSLFRLEDFPVLGSGFYDLSFDDDTGNSWNISVKVASVIKFDHARGEPIINFTVNLFSEDGKIRSQSINEENGIYGLYGGFPLSTELPVALDDSVNTFTATNDGTIGAEAKITITGDIVNPKIVNITNGRFFGLDLTVSSGETLIIDTAELTAEKNTVNVLANRSSGSNWLYVSPGENTFVLVGDNFDIDDQSKASIKLEWYHTKLT